MALASVSVCSALFFGSSSQEAIAAIVYDNGSPTIADGSEVTNFVVANDFTLSSATNVTGGAIYIAGFGGVGNWDGTFDYWVFADNSNTVGAALTNGSGVSVTSTSIGAGAWPHGGNTFRIDFNLASPFLAAAATKYWFGVHLSTNYNRDNIFWIRTPQISQALQGRGNSGSENGTFNNWTAPAATENAFYLNGSPAGGPVPEPTSLAIFGLGAVGAAYRARRKLVAG
ncbi:MAG: PEP-CTERM sorting domain-containing protein [Pirellulaceae bacterium]|jgi:hypothetical protein